LYQIIVLEEITIWIAFEREYTIKGSSLES